MSHLEIAVSIPGLSRADVSEIFGCASSCGLRFEVKQNDNDAGFNIDPGTVALLVSGTALVVQAIQAATEIYIARKNENLPSQQTQKVEIVVHLTLGGTRTATISDPNSIPIQLQELPNDPTLISRIEFL